MDSAFHKTSVSEDYAINIFKTRTIALSALSLQFIPMLEWSYLVVLVIGVIGSSVIHFSQGLMKLGILRSQLGQATSRSRWIYRVGVILNFTAPLWVVLANRFGPTALYTSMYAVGLLPLLLFSSVKLKDRASRAEILASVLIVTAAVLLAIGASQTMAVPLTDSNVRPFIWVALVLLVGLIIGLGVSRSLGWPSVGLLMGIVGGCFLAMDSLLKGIAQSDGGVVGFLPQTGTGLWLFFFSFIGAGIAFGMTQWAHVRGASPTQTIAAYDAGYVVLPILLMPMLGGDAHLNNWCIGGLLLMAVAITGLSLGRIRDS